MKMACLDLLLANVSNKISSTMLRVYLLASSRSISLHFTRERKSKPSVITVPFSCRAIATSALCQISRYTKSEILFRGKSSLKLARQNRFVPIQFFKRRRLARLIIAHVFLRNHFSPRSSVEPSR